MTKRWKSKDVKPTENKVYERRYESGVFYCRWENGHWYDSASNINEAAKAIWLSQAKLPWREI